jgi:uncharacterized protein (TIGR02453 family)
VTSQTTSFTGFSHEALQFLVDLAGNNERAWFQPRKAEYERLLKEPLEALCVALDERFRKQRLPLRADPATSPFRIYRDTRFSHDKTPYKTHIAANFPWVGDDSGAHGNGGYFHLSPGEAYIGGGMWHPEKERLAAFRALLVNDPARVHAAIEDKAFVRTFGQIQSHETLKRVPAGFPADHPEAELLKLKDLTFGRRIDHEDAFSPELPDLIARDFAKARPVFELLASLA